MTDPDNTPIESESSEEPELTETEPQVEADAPEDDEITEELAPKTPAATLSDEQLDLYRAAVEALLFASDRPMASRKIADLLNESSEGKAGLDGNVIRRLIDALRKDYDEQGRAFQIDEIAGGFQMLTRPEYHQWVRALASDRQQAKLSPAAIETLAIIAYKQPVGRAIVENIRGVQSGQMIRTLMEKRLVKVVGREDVVGRPLLYGTTKEFLDHFGLKNIRDLPNIRELPKPEE